MPDEKDLRFAKSHEWIHSGGSNGSVGISDHAQKEITDVVFVELPEVGRNVKQGEPVAVVESVKAAFDVYAPVSGEIVEVNDAVGKDPAIVNRSPYGDGWFYKIKLADAKELEALMTVDKYKEHAKAAAH